MLLDLLKQDIPVALLVHEERVLWARGPLKTTPETPISRLVHGIYARFTDTCRTIIRQRIFYTGAITPYCEGILRVAAKRATHGLPEGFTLEAMPAEEITSVLPYENELPTVERPSQNTNPFERCLDLERDIARTEVARFRADRPVAAVLVDGQGNLLAEGINSGSKSRTRHAEVEVVHAYWARTGQRIPAGSTLYTTLKPCRMCASLLWWFAEDPTHLTVLYRDFDPGPHGRATILDIGSPDRLKWATSEERNIHIQREWG